LTIISAVHSGCNSSVYVLYVKSRSLDFSLYRLIFSTATALDDLPNTACCAINRPARARPLAVVFVFPFASGDAVIDSVKLPSFGVSERSDETFTLSSQFNLALPCGVQFVLLRWRDPADVGLAFQVFSSLSIRFNPLMSTPAPDIVSTPTRSVRQTKTIAPTRP
jgi:hypothetical protein